MNTQKLIDTIKEKYVKRSRENLSSSKIYLDSINFEKLSFFIKEQFGLQPKDTFMWAGLQVHKVSTLEEHIEVF